MKKLGSGIIATLAALSTAYAQPTQEGLVNVNISDVTVQIPVAVAANICDVDINVLVSELVDGPTQCGADAGSIAIVPDDNDPAPRQEGLINVNISDVDAQVPIAIAANVCGVAVNVLVQDLRDGAATCEADGVSVARP